MAEPATQNPYMYCRGNPIKYSDPSGYSSTDEDLFFKAKVYEPPGSILRPLSPNEPLAPREGVIDTSVDNIFGTLLTATGIVKITTGAILSRKATSIDQIFKNPNVLNNMSEEEVRQLGKKEFLDVGTLNKGHAKGKGLRIRDIENDRTLYHELEGGHHGECWKLTKGGKNGGTIHIGPQFPKYKGSGF